jgi:DNA repair protein RadD
MFELRKYQNKGVEDSLEVLRGKPRKSIVIQPTGAGKSLIIAKVVKELDLPVIILQPSKELLKQNYQKFLAFGGEASIYCASLKTKSIDRQDYTEINGELKRCDEVSKVTFGTIGSIKKDIEKFRKLGVKHIIIDEVHLASKTGSQVRTFIKNLKATHVLGLTATAIYLQGGMMGSRLVMINRTRGTLFRDICHVTQIRELVDNGYWTPLNYKVIKTDESSLKLNTAGSDYTEYSQKEYYKTNNLKSQIVEEVVNLKAEGRKRILIFVPSIQEANELYSLIPNSAVVHSKLSTKDRDFMIDEFTNGDIPVAINVNVLATGYDNPEIDAIITSRPTSSIAIFYQQIGRGCRLHPDKKDCIITDFSGNTSRFGRVEDLSFENIEGYGWGLFNDRNGELLTDYPISAYTRPTKESLIAAHRQKEAEKNKPVPVVDNPEFYFGKFKGQKLLEVMKKDDGKSYCAWLADEKTKFEWWGEKGQIFKRALHKALNLPFKEEPKKPVNTNLSFKDILNNHTNSFNINNLNKLF